VDNCNMYGGRTIGELIIFISMIYSLIWRSSAMRENTTVSNS